jgi:hypothetical protein
MAAVMPGIEECGRAEGNEGCQNETHESCHFIRNERVGCVSEPLVV